MNVQDLKSVQSNFGPEETMNRLEAEIKAHGMGVFARINHAALAADAGLKLLQATSRMRLETKTSMHPLSRT